MKIDLERLEAVEGKLEGADRALVQHLRLGLAAQETIDERVRYLPNTQPANERARADAIAMLARVRAARDWDDGRRKVLDRLAEGLALAKGESAARVGVLVRQATSFAYSLVPPERTEPWHHEVLAAILDVTSEVARRVRGG